ncbi:MPN311 family protein [Mycoplasmoides genitalium]
MVNNEYQQLNTLVESDDEADLVIANLVKQLNELKQILVSLDNQEASATAVTDKKEEEYNQNQSSFHNFSKETLQKQAKRGFLLLERCSLVGLQQLELEYVNLLGRSFDSYQQKTELLNNLKELVDEHFSDTEKIINTLEKIFDVIGGSEYTPVLNSFFNKLLSDPDPIQREIGLRQFIITLRQRFKKLSQKIDSSLKQIETEAKIATEQVQNSEVMFGPPDIANDHELNLNWPDSETDAILSSMENELEAALLVKHQEEPPLIVTPPSLIKPTVSQPEVEVVTPTNNTNFQPQVDLKPTDLKKQQKKKPLNFITRPVFKSNLPPKLSKDDIVHYAHQLLEKNTHNE